MDCWEMSKLFEIRNWVNDIEKYVESLDPLNHPPTIDQFQV